MYSIGYNHETRKYSVYKNDRKVRGGFKTEAEAWDYLFEKQDAEEAKRGKK